MLNYETIEFLLSSLLPHDHLTSEGCIADAVVHFIQYNIHLFMAQSHITTNPIMEQINWTKHLIMYYKHNIITLISALVKYLIKYEFLGLCE